MIFISRIITVILALTMLQSCTGMNKQGGGTIIGGVTGALLGSRFGKGSGALAATGVGALVGAFAGSMIGKSMDDQDQRLVELASQRALETGVSGSNVEWRNPDNGNYGYVTPTKTFRNDHGRYCREYNQVVVIGGKQEKAYGTACRQPDGHWEIAK